MKNLKLILILSLVFSFYGIKANAQGKANPASQDWFESSYWTPVFCDGELVDELDGGVLLVHYVSRWVPFVSYKEVDKIKREVTSSLTGEVFKVRETDKYLGAPDFFNVTWHYNLICDKGTHYHGTITQDINTGEITVGKMVCN